MGVGFLEDLAQEIAGAARIDLLWLDRRSLALQHRHLGYLGHRKHLVCA